MIRTSQTPTGLPTQAGPAAEPGAVISALMEEAQRAEFAGRRAIARQRYESALYLLRDATDNGAASAILRRVARTYLDDGDVQAGQDCLAAALAVAEACDNATEIAHTINLMANSYVQRGQLDEGARMYAEAARMAEVSADERLLAIVEANLGVIASMRGDDTTALRYYTTSGERYRALGMKQELGKQLSNIGMVYAGLGRLVEAEIAFAEAYDIARTCGDAWTSLMVEVNRIGLLLQRGAFSRARSLCDHVLLEASSLRDTRMLAETYKYYGVIARETGSLRDAENYLRLAYDQAMSREDLLLAAETAREQAEVYLALGRNRETLQALSTSHRLFMKLRARRDLADVTARLRKLERRFHDLVQDWAQSIESKDAYTLGHCQRVADVACAIATDMGFDETTLFWFRVGALLHDVGKIDVPYEILNKAGPLTPEERAIMEQHPVAGVELLRDVDFPWDVLPMVRGHHERWDGHGYPDRLAGESIPVPARILCVADVYDALTSHRPYRRAFEPRDALRLMQAEIGRQFDPDILGRFFRLAPNLLRPEDAAAPEIAGSIGAMSPPKPRVVSAH